MHLPTSAVVSILGLCVACSGTKGAGSEEPSASDPASTLEAGAGAEPSTVTLFDDVRISSHEQDEHFQKARALLDFGPGPFSRVTLVADLRSTCFPFTQWRDDPPPAGQSFPPLCDAFDRNFEITLDEPKNDGDPPAFELIRAITPFGGPLHLEQDLTDLANARPSTHEVQVFIATWSDGAGRVTGSHGGWNVSAHLDIVPGAPPRKVLGAQALLNESFDPRKREATRPFVLPAGARKLRIEARVTGHGGGEDSQGCFGPAEEFCEREHRFEVDGKLVQVVEPLRDDCAKLCTLTRGPNDLEYCAQNPTGLPASVRAERAGWCPGSLTEPLSWSLTVKPGPEQQHSFRHVIERIAEGGSWRVSATVYSFAE